MTPSALAGQATQTPSTPPAPRVVSADPSVEVTRVSVRDFGAVGDGIADDSDAIRQARDAVLGDRVPAKTNRVARELFFPAGVYRVTQPDTLLSSPTEGEADQVWGYTIRGQGKSVSLVVFDSAAEPTDDPTRNNLLTAANRVAELRVHSLSFYSENENQRFMWLWSNVQNGERTEFPQFGSDDNQDLYFGDVGWGGSWQRGFGLDGGRWSNMNSEWVFDRCNLAGDAVFTDAFLHSGLRPEYEQQDQFLNFSFRDCKFEYTGGDCLRFDKGGFITVTGGSWILKEAGTLFRMGPYDHVDSVQTLSVIGTRVELRSTESRLLDTHWSGTNSHITFRNVSDAARAFQDWAPDCATVVLHAFNGSIAQVRFQDCELMGYHVVEAERKPRGRVVYDMCNFTNYPKGGVGKTSDAVMLRHRGDAPRYRFVDCEGVEDEST